MDRSLDDAGDGLTVQDIQSFITTQGTSGGSAELDPFTSWNVDLSLEWYPDADTVLAAGLYFKRFKGGYQNTFVNTTVAIQSDGDQGANAALNANLAEFPQGANGLYLIDAPISSVETTNDNANLFGLELSASHSLSYLSGFIGGFGGKLGYNYADSDFKFEDDFAGAGVGVDENGDEVQLVGLVPPAEIFGLSRHVFSGQLYWDNGLFNATTIYKYRSQYFQQFVDDPGRVRFIDDNAVVEFKAGYKLTDNISLRFEALNITNEPRVDFRGLDGNVSQVLSFGRRYFVGIKAKY